MPNPRFLPLIPIEGLNWSVKINSKRLEKPQAIQSTLIIEYKSKARKLYEYHTNR